MLADYNVVRKWKACWPRWSSRKKPKNPVRGHSTQGAGPGTRDTMGYAEIWSRGLCLKGPGTTRLTFPRNPWEEASVTHQLIT